MSERVEQAVNSSSRQRVTLVPGHIKASTTVGNSVCTEVSAGRAQAATADSPSVPSPGSSFTEHREWLVCKISSQVIFLGTFNIQ